MRLTYKHLKKISSDDNCTTLQHADGHTIKIAHKGLSKEMREKLDNVPGFYDAGLVDADTKESEPGILDAMASNEAAMAQVNPFVQAPAGFEQAAQPSITPSQAAPTQAPGRENAPLPTKTEQYEELPGMQVDTSGLQQQEAGIKAEAKAQGALGRAEQAAAIDHQQQMLDLQRDSEDEFSRLDFERKSLMEDIASNRIDPDRVWSSKSDLNKVGTAIGLILGGIGAGAAGTSNVALDFLNKQIDRDIEGQKFDMSKKENLLKATMAQFGNLKDATAMTKLMYTDMYAAKLQEAAAKSKDPIAKARAEQAIGALKAQTAPLQAEIAHRQAVLKGVAAGKYSPASAIDVAVKKEQRDTAYKELAAVENAQRASDDIKNLMGKAKELQSLKSRLGSPHQSKAKLEAFKTEIMGSLKPIFGTLSESDKEQVNSLTAEFVNDPGTIEEKMKVLQRIATKGQLATPVLDAAGIKIKKPSDTPSAKKNPNVRR